MNGRVIWQGERECLLETLDGVFSVTDPSLVSSIRDCFDAVEKQSKVQFPGSLTAATLASVLEINNVNPHEAPSVAPSRTRGFGSLLPRRQISTLPDVSFAAVLEARHSVREFGAPNEADLLDLLTFAARSRFEWPTQDGRIASSRPSPSAGALHPIEIVIAALEVRGLVPGMYWFDPVQCRLAVLPASYDEAREVAVRAQAALAVDDTPPTVLCLVAELQRTLSRYAGGMSLILRDSGAMMATMCLVATALGLASCPVGIGGESPALGVLGVKYPEWAEVGALAIGRPLAT